MDPISLAILGTTGLSSIIGGIGANNANKRNNDIALMNYYQQQNANRRAGAEARGQQLDAKLGATDATGSRTYFDPDQGWITDLSQPQQDATNASLQAMIRQLTEGDARAEQVDARAVGRRNREDVLASGAEDEYTRAQRPDTEALRQLFLARGAQTRNESADRAGAATGMRALRAGGGFDAAELTRRARAQSDQEAAQQQGIEAQLMADDESDRRYNNERDNAARMYDFFRRSSTSGTAAPSGYMPAGPQQQSTGVANQGLINALARAPQQEYVAPNQAFAGTINDLSTGLLGFMNRRDNAATRDAILSRVGSNSGSF